MSKVERNRRKIPLDLEWRKTVFYSSSMRSQSHPSQTFLNLLATINCVRSVHCNATSIFRSPEENKQNRKQNKNATMDCLICLFFKFIFASVRSLGLVMHLGARQIHLLRCSHRRTKRHREIR